MQIVMRATAANHKSELESWLRRTRTCHRTRWVISRMFGPRTTKPNVTTATTVHTSRCQKLHLSATAAATPSPWPFTSAKALLSALV